VSWQRLVILWAVALALLLSGCGGGAVPPPPSDNCPPIAAVAARRPSGLGSKEPGGGGRRVRPQRPVDRILVRFRVATKQEVQALHERVGARPVRVIEPLGWEVVQVSPERVQAALAAYRASGLVEAAESDGWAYLQIEPNDPLYAFQWHYRSIRLPEAWNCTTGSPGVVVAVIDDGITDHPDMRGVFTSGYDFVDNDPDPTWPGCRSEPAEFSHGMHVAATITALSNNGTGVAGVNWGPGGARIMPLRAFGACADDVGRFSDIATAIVYAADRGAHVINMSFGSQEPSDLLATAVRYAHAKGAVLVAAAGNDFPLPISYPARYPEVIAVGATNCRNESAAYSAEGPELDLVAPGGSAPTECNLDGAPQGDLVLSASTNLNQGHGYFRAQGTSMAAAHVSGVAALLVARGLRGPEAVRARLRETAVDLGDPGRDDRFGWGLVDARAAVGAR
jgi:subtilisin family serine protease